MAHDLRDYNFLEEISGLFGSIFLLLLPNKIHTHVFRQWIFSSTLSYTEDSPGVLILVKLALGVQREGNGLNLWLYCGYISMECVLKFNHCFVMSEL